MIRIVYKLFPRVNCSNSARRTICLTAARHVEESKDSGDAPTVLVEKDSHITLIGLNREQKRNSIDALTAQKLGEAISQFEADDTSPVGVLYGIGGSFCAGYDLEELQAEADRGSLNFLLRHEGSVGPTRRHLRKPIVCGISGFCVAGGLELALLCDLRVMEDTAVLGFFNRRLGVPISDGGTVRLAAAVGFSNALDIIETGRRVYAREALRIGLVNRIVATGTALGQAVNLAFSIAKFPMGSLMHDRNAVLENANTYNRPGFYAGTYNEVMNVTSEMVTDMQEGVRRFKTSEEKGPKTDSWHIKEKTIPDWEKAEIELEKQLKKT
ncbi:probable enoyl-CoA hydratase [Drosophila miranda]|uniref:probable enoyl-CoA hydratase n=1 Tax=Drosophila miranda TaxID=7229 RepID=UPI0007E78603|nr:probable enoyl-CoA hydratase [Drosophila miranda]XP_033245720.1 probable enoyl-CoA hydratase [Drosophila miranda]